jgi:glycosyl transferase family 87
LASFVAALRNRRFRSLLLAISGIPIAASYLWNALLQPLLIPSSIPTDFREAYLSAATAIATGHDPYGPCHNLACFQQLTDSASVYPPLLGWLLQPVLGVNPRVLDAGALIACHLFVLMFLVSVVVALRISDWQVIAVVVIATLSYPPLLDQIRFLNVQVALLGLSGVWFLGWMRGDIWWGGVAAGIGIALKLVQGPALLLMALRRRFRMLLSALAVWAALWVVAAPQHLPKYLFTVLPVAGGGTGYAKNIAPIATLARVLHPWSMGHPDLGTGVGPLERTVALLFAVGAFALTAYVLGRSERPAEQRSLEVAAVVAMTPLLSTLLWPGQLALLLLPIVVLVAFAIKVGDWRLLLLTGVAWMLTGPVYLAFTNAYAAGYFWLPVIQLWAETALIGTVLLWVTTLVSLRWKGESENQQVNAPLGSTSA